VHSTVAKLAKSESERRKTDAGGDQMFLIFPVAEVWLKQRNTSASIDTAIDPLSHCELSLEQVTFLRTCR
jgi:hypothetical protein